MLTATECKNARCPEGKKWSRLSDGGGLYLEVWPAGPKSPEGMKAWRWKYRHEGKEKRLALGTFPAVSLAEARSRRDAARRQLDAGTDAKTPKPRNAGLFHFHRTSPWMRSRRPACLPDRADRPGAVCPDLSPNPVGNFGVKFCAVPPSA